MPSTCCQVDSAMAVDEVHLRPSAHEHLGGGLAGRLLARRNERTLKKQLYKVSWKKVSSHQELACQLP